MGSRGMDQRVNRDPNMLMYLVEEMEGRWTVNQYAVLASGFAEAAAKVCVGDLISYRYSERWVNITSPDHRQCRFGLVSRLH